jgi:hypothetical protein
MGIKLTRIIFLATPSDMANLTVLKRLKPRHGTADILGDALRAYRRELESQPPREPIHESAADSIRDLFGD